MTLQDRLRGLSRHEHSDFSLGDEAADELDAKDARIKELEGANEMLMHSLKHFADESKWGPVADYSAGYWYMTGKPWIPAQTAIKRAREALNALEP